MGTGQDQELAAGGAGAGPDVLTPWNVDEWLARGASGHERKRFRQLYKVRCLHVCFFLSNHRD